MVVTVAVAVTGATAVAGSTWPSTPASTPAPAPGPAPCSTSCGLLLLPANRPPEIRVLSDGHGRARRWTTCRPASSSLHPAEREELGLPETPGRATHDHARTDERMRQPSADDPDAPPVRRPHLPTHRPPSGNGGAGQGRPSPPLPNSHAAASSRALPTERKRQAQGKRGPPSEGGPSPHRRAHCSPALHMTDWPGKKRPQSTAMARVKTALPAKINETGPSTACLLHGARGLTHACACPLLQPKP